MLLRKVTICLLFELIFVNAFSQEYPDMIRQQKVSRWSIGGMISPDFGGRFFKPDERESEDGFGIGTDINQNRDLAKMLANNEHYGLQYTMGAHFVYDLGKRWFARLGIYYSQKTIRADGFISYRLEANGFVYVDGGSSKSHFPFLEIPLTFHYILNKPYDKNKQGTCYTTYADFNRKKPLFYIFAGPVYAVNIGKHHYPSRRATTFEDSLYTNTTQVYVDPFSINHFGIYIGAGVMRYFNKHIYITAEPVFRFLPSRWYSKKFEDKPDDQDNDWKPKATVYHVIDKPWSVGLQVAVNYHF